MQALLKPCPTPPTPPPPTPVTLPSTPASSPSEPPIVVDVQHFLDPLVRGHEILHVGVGAVQAAVLHQRAAEPALVLVVLVDNIQLTGRYIHTVKLSCWHATRQIHPRHY